MQAEEAAMAAMEERWQARVAVKPAGSSSAPFAVANPRCYFTWQLSKQPESEGEVAGCWMVDGVMPDAPTME